MQNTKLLLCNVYPDLFSCSQLLRPFFDLTGHVIGSLQPQLQPIKSLAEKLGMLILTELTIQWWHFMQPHAYIHMISI